MGGVDHKRASPAGPYRRMWPALADPLPIIITHMQAELSNITLMKYYKFACERRQAKSGRVINASFRDSPIVDAAKATGEDQMERACYERFTSAAQVFMKE
jgi:hypothetical protein